MFSPNFEIVNVDVDVIIKSLAALRNEVPLSGNVEFVNKNKTLTAIEVPNAEEILNESPLTDIEPQKSSPEITIGECERQPIFSKEKVPPLRSNTSQMML